MDLQIKLNNLKELRKGAKDADMMKTLSIDIHNIERALEVEREARSSGPTGIFPPSSHDRVNTAPPSGETDTEFRSRAARQLSDIEEV
jgi:hypothetical protein